MKDHLDCYQKGNQERKVQETYLQTRSLGQTDRQQEEERVAGR